MWNKIKLKRMHTVALAFVFVFVMIGLVEKNHGSKSIQRVAINIEQQYDNFFVDRADIHKLISDENKMNIIGMSMNKIELKAIEERLTSNKNVKTADVYKDLKGTLIVKIKQRRPLARFIRDSGPDAYVSEDGVVLPTSDRFTARVVLISGHGVDEIVKQDLAGNEAYEGLMELLHFIDKDPFWKAQIAQIKLEDNNELTMYPQIGKQVISFGNTDDYETKFRNLKIFFKKVLPMKGWNYYKRVNIKYKNQIVCE